MKRSIINFSILFYSSVVLLSFSGCKKGEDDPAVSLRSRKARVEGEWKVSNANISETSEALSSDSDSTSSSVTNFEGDVYTHTYTSSYMSDNYNYSETIASEGIADIGYTFKKDGTFTAVYTTELEINSSSQEDLYFPPFTRITTIKKSETKTHIKSGTWDFISGTNESKNRESIMLTYTNAEITGSGVASTTIDDSNAEPYTESSSYTLSETIYYDGAVKTEIWHLKRLSHKELTAVIEYSASRGGTNSTASGEDTYTININGSGSFSLSQNK